jgi:beta propeller repeat protein
LFLLAVSSLCAATLCACGGDEPAGPGGEQTPTVATVAVTPTTSTLLSIGETVQLAATARDASGDVISGQTFTWASSATGVVTVDATGLATAVDNGTATVTASAGGEQGSADVTVLQVATDVQLATVRDTLTGLGDTTRVIATAFDANDHPAADQPMWDWSSVDPTVATVDASGLVTAVGSGTARIVAVGSGLAPDTVSFTVRFRIVHIVDNLASKQSPEIDGNRIVWSDDRNGNADIFVYDLATGQETQVTSHSGRDHNARISGDRIVWQSNRDNQGNEDIYLYDLSTSTETRITTSAENQTQPDISGDKIVWIEVSAQGRHVFVRNLTAASDIQLTTESAPHRGRVRMEGDDVVWEEDYDIVAYDLTTNARNQITDDPASQTLGDISGNRIVIWEAEPESNVLVHDMGTGQTDTVTACVSAGCREPAISGSRVVYERSVDTTLQDVLLFDLAAGFEVRLAPPDTRVGPTISGDLVAWLDFDGNVYVVNLKAR